MYLVTAYYRGSLHIDPMRWFPTEEQAQIYAHDYIVCRGNQPRIYLISSEDPPVLIKYRPPEA